MFHFKFVPLHHELKNTFFIMAIVFNKYIDSKDHTWYDSSNVLYSLCYDNASVEKTLKVVFNQGRTYLYKDVDAGDYLSFKTSQSSGKGLNQYIVKKYAGVRIQDTDLEELEKLKNEFIEDNNQIEQAMTNLAYHLSVNDNTGEFALSLNGKVLYRGIEGQVSILNLLRSMNINYTFDDEYNGEDVEQTESEETTKTEEEKEK